MAEFSKQQTSLLVKSFLACIFIFAMSMSCTRQDDPLSLTAEVISPTQPSIEQATMLAKVPTLTSLPTVVAFPTGLPTATPMLLAEASPTDVVTETAVSTRVYATPAHAADAYQLKEWTDDEAYNVVSAMREQIDLFESEPEEHYFMAHVRYATLHRPLEIAVREGFHRFPNSRHKYAFLWHQAMAMAFRDMPQKSPSSLIVSLLEEGLLRGEYDPDDWHSDYKIYDFILNKQFLVPNLLGDGQIVPIYKIQSIKSLRYGGDDGLFFAVVENEGEYELLPMTDFWHAGFGYWGHEAEIADHTKDGIPELILFPRYHSQIACGDDDILQWNGEEFVNLARNPDGRNIGAVVCLEYLVFEETDADTADKIIVYEDEWFNDVSFPQQKTFVWNGEAYQLVETAVTLPEDAHPHTLVEYHIYQKDYGAAAESIDPLLSYLQDGPFNLDPSYLDFYRFRQAWLYAFDGQAAKSREAFQSLIDNPVNPITPTLSIAAQSFLDHYQDQNDLYQACQMAQETMIATLTISDPRGENDALQAWGYTYGMNNLPCDLSLARQSLFEHVEMMQLEEGLQFLEQAGVKILDKKTVDLNQDGEMEWLLVIRIPSEYGGEDFDQWIVFETNIGIQFANLRDLPEAAVKWEIYYPTKADYPIHFIQDGKDFRISRFAIEDDGFEEIDYIPYRLNGDIEDFSVTMENEILKVDIDFLGNTTDFENVTLIWNSDIEEFEVIATNIPHFTGTSLYGVTDAAKKLIFEKVQYEEAAAMLTEFHKVNEDAEADYLLGLAYELLGQTDTAVETYWQLWQDYPESEYAIIVQQKLELK